MFKSKQWQGCCVYTKLLACFFRPFLDLLYLYSTIDNLYIEPGSHNSLYSISRRSRSLTYVCYWPLILFLYCCCCFVGCAVFVAGSPAAIVGCQIRNLGPRLAVLGLDYVLGDFNFKGTNWDNKFLIRKKYEMFSDNFRKHWG